jgi:cytochrome c553
MIRSIITLFFVSYVAMPAVYATPPAEPDNTHKIIKTCKACHGKDFKGKKATPSIYGQSFSVIYTALTSDVPKKMEKIVKKLSKEEAMAIASYIAHLNEEPLDESERD